MTHFVNTFFFYEKSAWTLKSINLTPMIHSLISHTELCSYKPSSKAKASAIIRGRCVQLSNRLLGKYVYIGFTRNLFCKTNHYGCMSIIVSATYARSWKG